MSPQAGALDEVALARLGHEDRDAAMRLVADLAQATDETVRRKARELAQRIVLPPPRELDRRRRGRARLRTTDQVGVDLDLDATLERMAEHPRLRSEDLRWRDWTGGPRSTVLVVDTSGSTAGAPIATAVTALAALLHRLGRDDEVAVVAFWSDAVVLRHLRSHDPVGAAIDRLLDLRAGSTTDLALGLRTALIQLRGARAHRPDVVVVSDGLATKGVDPMPVAASAPAAGARLHVLGLSEDDRALARCTALADAGGGRFASLRRASDAPRALAEVLAP